MSQRDKLDRDLERVARGDGVELFPKGRYVMGPVTAEVIRVDGPGGPALNPRVRPIEPAEPLFEAFLAQVLTLELPRLLQHLRDQARYDQPASPPMFAGTPMFREGWSLEPGEGGSTLMRLADGSTATIADEVLAAWLVLALRAAVHPFDGTNPKEPPWVDQGRVMLESPLVQAQPAPTRLRPLSP